MLAILRFRASNLGAEGFRPRLAASEFVPLNRRPRFSDRLANISISAALLELRGVRADPHQNGSQQSDHAYLG